MSGENAPAKAPANDPLDFKQEQNALRFIRPSRWLALDIAGKPVLRCNWVTSLLASVVLWGFIIWAMAGGSNTRLEVGDWQSWVTINFTWLYIGTQDVWFVFVLALLFTKYRHIKLGKDDEEPAFGDYEWFSMLFACGIGVGLYSLGVQEPMGYYRGTGNAAKKIPFDNDDQRAQQAILITLFHWGLHAWIPYVTVALTLGVVCYRQGRPMTIRSAFYPVLGENIYGLVGDLIDALSIACTTFGVCTSLGLGVGVIATTMNRLNHNINADSETVKSLIIWCITAAATTSVLCGLKVGIKNLSQITFSIGLIFLFSLVLADSPFFLMNSFVQSMGHYLQWITVLGWDCDTWPQWTGVVTRADNGWGSKTMAYLTWGRTGAYDAIQAATAAYTAGEAGTTMLGANTANNIATAWGSTTGAQWIDYWTIFYWGWWISWAPFVGMFIARISRGRTVQQVIMGAFIAPCIFGFFFLTVLGTLGIKMQRVAELALGNDSGAVDWETGAVDCDKMGYTTKQPSSSAAIELANQGYYALACRDGNDQILDMVEPYGSLSRWFQLLILVGVILYFVTSSDSGSYVDDLVSSQGYEAPPPFQKIYWACTEGALAQALVTMGTDGGLKAVRSISIVAGLPYTLAINFMMVALWRVLKEESGELVNTRRGFNTCIFDFLEAFKPETGGANAPDQKARLVSVAKGLLYPFDAVRKSHLAVGDDERTSTFYGAIMTALVYLWIGLLAATGAGAGTHTIAWLMLCIFCFKLAGLRRRLREARNVAGNVMEDYSCAMLMYPFCAAQMEHEADASDKTA